jgi:hypothetical protein
MKSASLFTKLAAGLGLAFFLLLAGQLRAQTITSFADLYKNSGDPLQGTSTNTGNTVFCSGSAAFTLVSSLTVPSSTPAVPYSTWNWQELQADGTWSATIQSGAPVPGELHKLRMTDAEPGWHTYRVIAAVSAAGCLADPVLYTVYVLPPLAIEARANKATDEALTYCAENGAPASGTPEAIKFTATPSFSTQPRAVPGSGGTGTVSTLPALTAADFKINYQWYKVEVGVGGAGTAVGADDDEYEVSEAATGSATTVKQYTYRVEANYQVKDCGLKNAVALHSAGTGTATVTVTPKPGAPVITIE